MRILGNRVLVSKVEEPQAEGFNAVQVLDSFTFKGKVEEVGMLITFEAHPGYVAPLVKEGDIVLFAKYSPDTQEVEVEEQTMKIIKVEDILAIL